jgi:hypothetical protein
MKLFGVSMLVIFIAILATGCTGTIFKTFSIDDDTAKSISMDARQRLVIVTDRGGPEGNRRVVCAEPSPDAFMALAASAGANVSIGEKEAGGYGTMAEAAGALGLRTQTIQLMRDTLYRSCEAYMNGLINEKEYRKMLTAFDELLITLVAIEGLGRPNIGALPQIATQATRAENGDKETANAKGTVSSESPNYTHVATDPKVAKSMHQIVRDYYCFQLAMKQIFYPHLAKELDPAVLKSLCGE